MTAETRSKSAVNLDIKRVAGRIGAEIGGLNLSEPLDQPTIAAVRQAFLEHKVLFFRGQKGFDFLKQEAFSKQFGELVPHPTIGPVEGTESALDIVYANGDTAANEWHADETFLEAPHMAGILTPVELPSYGGDTLWANTAAAYESLPEPLKELADRLWAVHANTSQYNSARRHPKAVSWIFEAEHPVVRVHPETGERLLLLGFHAQRLVGMSKHDSPRLIQIFQDHITRPENTVRWHWELGDVAFWDNRTTQHYGIGDFTERRQLHRVSLLGDVPVGVDGRPGKLLRKEEFRTTVAG